MLKASRIVHQDLSGLVLKREVVLSSSEISLLS